MCNGRFSALYHSTGTYPSVATHNFSPEALEAIAPRVPRAADGATGGVAAIVGCAVVHIPDVEIDPEHKSLAVRAPLGGEAVVCPNAARGRSRWCHRGRTR